MSNEMVNLDFYIFKISLCLKIFQNIFCKMCGFGAVSCPLLRQRKCSTGAGSEPREAKELLHQLVLGLLCSCPSVTKIPGKQSLRNIISDEFASLPPLRGGTWGDSFLQHSFTLPSWASEQYLDKNLSRFILWNGQVKCKLSLLRNPITLQ